MKISQRIETQRILWLTPEEVEGLIRERLCRMFPQEPGIMTADVTFVCSAGTYLREVRVTTSSTECHEDPEVSL